MKIEKKYIDPDKDIFDMSANLIKEADETLNFELHVNDENAKMEIFPVYRELKLLKHADMNAIFSLNIPINEIEIKGCAGFKTLTLTFGTFGHIHLTGKEQIKKFVEAVNFAYEEELKHYFDAEKE